MKDKQDCLGREIKLGSIVVVSRCDGNPMDISIVVGFTGYGLRVIDITSTYYPSGINALPGDIIYNNLDYRKRYFRGRAVVTIDGWYARTGGTVARLLVFEEANLPKELQEWCTVIRKECNIQKD